MYATYIHMQHIHKTGWRVGARPTNEGQTWQGEQESAARHAPCQPTVPTVYHCVCVCVCVCVLGSTWKRKKSAADKAPPNAMSTAFCPVADTVTSLQELKSAVAYASSTKSRTACARPVQVRRLINAAVARRH
jgi:hypothetical protein